MLDSDSEKATQFSSTFLLFYFEGKLSVLRKAFLMEKSHS